MLVLCWSARDADSTFVLYYVLLKLLDTQSGENQELPNWLQSSYSADRQTSHTLYWLNITKGSSITYLVYLVIEFHKNSKKKSIWCTQL